MNLIDGLKTNFVAAQAKGSYQAPQNLSELRAQLRDACQRKDIHPHLPHYCNWYSQYLTRVHDQENKSMVRTRGKARKMWAEQSLIYQDMIHLLADVAEMLPQRDWKGLRESTNSLYELVDEFTDALNEMEEWTRSEEPRCLKCGWNGSSGHCPHCKVQVLKPIRDYATHVNHFITLAPLQSRIVEVMRGVLEGTRDVSGLRGPLQALQQKFQESVAYLQGKSHSEVAQAGLENVERGLAGIEQMMRVFQDFDAQHLEDGWALIYEGDSRNQELVASIPSAEQAVAAAYEIILDHVSFSNEE